MNSFWEAFGLILAMIYDNSFFWDVRLHFECNYFSNFIFRSVHDVTCFLKCLPHSTLAKRNTWHSVARKIITPLFCFLIGAFVELVITLFLVIFFFCWKMTIVGFTPIHSIQGSSKLEHRGESPCITFIIFFNGKITIVEASLIFLGCWRQWRIGGGAIGHGFPLWAKKKVNFHEKPVKLLGENVVCLLRKIFQKKVSRPLPWPISGSATGWWAMVGVFTPAGK